MQLTVFDILASFADLAPTMQNLFSLLSLAERNSISFFQSQAVAELQRAPAWIVSPLSPSSRSSRWRSRAELHRARVALATAAGASSHSHSLATAGTSRRCLRRLSRPASTPSRPTRGARRAASARAPAGCGTRRRGRGDQRLGQRGQLLRAGEPRLPLHHTAVAADAAQQVVLVLVDGLLAHR
jgi:hypothetical protein